MAQSLNKAMIIGRIGSDPETRNFQKNGGMVVNFSIATSEQWKDKATGERKEKTEWHRVSIFNEHIAKIASQYCKKGQMVYIEGQIETRKWTDKNNIDRYTTEIVLRPYSGSLNILSGEKKSEGDDGQTQPGGEQNSYKPQPSHSQIQEDEIPF